MLSLIKELLGVFISAVTVGGIITGFVTKWIDKKFIKPVSLDIKDLRSELKEMEIKRLRSQILTFTGSLHRGVEHTRVEFEDVMRMHDSYDELLKKTNKTNGYVTKEMDYLYKCYENLDTIGKGE